jgi:hypothetical protein
MLITSQAQLADSPGTQRSYVLKRKNSLHLERSSWLAHWREISQVQQPRLGRFLVTDRNKGGKEKMRHNHILDNTAVRSSATLAAGMMSGMTSPARPWFRLTLEDTALAESPRVKQWLHDVNQRMLRIYAASNTYRSLHSCYEELGLFGTWADFMMPNFETVVHHMPMTIGEYALATNELGVVDTMCREMQMTVRQLVQKFGRDNCSQTVRNLYDAKNYDAWVDVVHLVEPRDSYDPRKGDNLNMPFASCYVEIGKDDWDKPLRESGFKEFPVLAPRWTATSTDVYGHSPGMECLGDVNSLQFSQRRKAQGIDYQTNPPIGVPSFMRGRHVDRLPGGVTYYDASQNTGGIKSLFDVQLNLQHLREDILDTRQRIRESYFADMFLMLANDPQGQMTATEVAERHEEKLLMLGPVLERLHNELLNPLVERTFERMVEADMLTGRLQPPEELQGVDLKVEFVSILAQAQRAVSARGIDRLLGTVGNLAALWPGVTHKIKPMQVVDEYADLYGVNPEIIASDEEAEEASAAAAQQAASQQALAAAPGMATAAKAMGEVDGDNIQSIMRNLQGYDTLSPAVGS